MVEKWFTDYNIQLIQRLPSWRISVQYTSFCLKREKEDLVGLCLNEDSLKKTWVGVMRTTVADELAMTTRCWLVQRSVFELNHFLAMTVVLKLRTNQSKY
jgi:hypothetical protein